MFPKSIGANNAGDAPQQGDWAFSTIQGPVGLPRGTLVWTADGALPVEYLVAGDKVITRDGGLAELRALVDHHALTGMVRIPADSFGVGRPGLNVRLPAAQPVLVRGALAQMHCGAASVCVAAQTLVDWQVGEDLGRRSVRLVSPIFDRPRILYCSGLEIGSLGPEHGRLQP